MSVGRRRRKAAQRIAAERERGRHRKFAAKFSLCINGCGKPGPHYCPPSMGDPGFFMCTPTEAGKEAVRLNWARGS